MKLSNKGFTPLHPENQRFHARSNWVTKFMRLRKPRLLSRGVTGFTLIELLLASLIMAFVFIALLSVFLTCILLNESNRNLNVAITHAEHALEDIKNSDYYTVQSTVWNAATIAAKGLTALRNETINITVVTGTQIKNIRVVVNWNDRARPRSVTLQTLIAQP